MTLWDRTVETPGEIPVPESHLELAEARLKDYRNGPSDAPSFLRSPGSFGKVPKVTSYLDGITFLDQPAPDTPEFARVKPGPRRPRCRNAESFQ